MSARDKRDDFVESVLIAYAWPCSERVPKLPEDVMARWPPGEPLETAARVTGYICRGKMASDVRGRVYPSAATAVTFFRLQATTEQTRRFAEGAEGVIFRQSGASIVVWAKLDGISFDQLRDNQLQRVGLCAHLQKLNATSVLHALVTALRKYPSCRHPGHESKPVRRKKTLIWVSSSARATASMPREAPLLASRVLPCSRR